MGLTLFLFLHRIGAPSVEPLPPWSLLSMVSDSCSLASKEGGVEMAHGHSFEGRIGLNVNYGEVPSPCVKLLFASSKQGERSEISTGLMACMHGVSMVNIASLRCNEFK